MRATLLGALCLLLASPAHAADFFLRAGATTKTMPDGRVVPMWGFALDSSFGANNGVITVPGPVLTVPPGDPLLRIHLDNNLSVPISLIIHGQITTNTPVRYPGAGGRVRSFTRETPPGNGAAVTYTWSNVKPGTFLYQSGTHPQVQVPMGLYGAMKKDTNSLVAYPNVPYATDVTLLYSEIDPALNDAVAANDFGAGKSMTSAIDYEAKYFLINGRSFTNGTPPIIAGSANTRILLRFLNAGLEARVPVVHGYYVDEVAEDGNLHPFPKRQFALHLPPAKTLDALVTLTTCDSVAVYDRRLGLVNHTNSPGGMLTYLGVSGPLCAAGAGQVDVPYNSALVPGCGTPPYTFSILSGALPNGLTLNPTTGTITGTPTIAGTNNYVAQVTDSVGGSATVSCSITIAPGALIGKWKFDESSGTTAADSSGLGNHGRLTNGPVFGPGRIGNSLTFDGINDHVVVPDANPLDFNGRNFTVALWVKTTSTSPQALVEKQTPNANFSGMFLFALDRDNAVSGGFSVWTGGLWIDSNFRAVTDGQWHLLAITYDGTTFRLYRDGQLDKTQAASVNYINTSLPLNFGRFASQNVGWPFQGMLDEICLFNQALSPAQIAALVSPPAGPTFRTLTVNSSGATNVPITVSPAATNGLSNGNTTFSRVYSNNTVVTLTAPATNGVNNFVNWQRDGTNYSTSLTTNLTMDANHTMTAVYQAPGPATRTLTVASVNPTNGVSITVSPPGGNGTTLFTRVYTNTVVVTLTAPATAGSNSFSIWQRDGTNYSTSLTTNLTMDANHTMTAVYQAPITTGMAGYWKLDDGTGTTALDSSGLNNHGRLTNGAVFSATGRVNGSLTLDGVNDFAFVPDAEVLDFNARNFTVALWVKTSNTVAQALVEKQHSGFTGMFIFGLNRDGAVPGGFSVWTGTQWIDSTFRGVTDGQWHHLAVTHDGTRYRLYRDGILDKTMTATAPYVNTSLPLNFGRLATGGPNWHFRGMMDEIYKFNRALSDAEIAVLAGVP